MDNKLIPFPNRKYDIIYADPPWHAEPITSERYGGRGGIQRPYPCMTMQELQKLSVADIANDDCLLFLWVVSPDLDECIDVGKSWNFDYITVAFVWDKQWPVYGHYTIPQCELCLLFKHGKIPLPRGDRNIRQFLSLQKTHHSAKPHEVRRRIEKMFPRQSKIELFAREEREFWDAWGNEVNVEQDNHTVPHDVQPTLF